MQFIGGLFSFGVAVFCLGYALDLPKKKPYWRAFYFALAVVNFLTYFNATR